MVDKQVEDNLELFIEVMNKEMEGKIHVDEHGNCWRFHNGRWEGMCRVESISFEQHLRDNPMPTKTISEEVRFGMSAKEQAKIYNKFTTAISRTFDEGIASFLLSLPMAMSYEVWWHLHQIKGDLE